MCKSNLEYEHNWQLMTSDAQLEILESEINTCEIIHDFKKVHVSKTDNNDPIAE